MTAVAGPLGRKRSSFGLETGSDISESTLVEHHIDTFNIGRGEAPSYTKIFHDILILLRGRITALQDLKGNETTVATSSPPTARLCAKQR